MAEPYFIEVDSNGCDKCGHARTWIVVGPDECANSVSFEDENEAQRLADDLNSAYFQGHSQSEKRISELEAQLAAEKFTSEQLQRTIDSMKAEIAGDAENYRSIIAAGEQYAKKLQDELTHLSNLCRRWNVALSKFCAGSEFVDDPERVASGIQEAITFAESIGRVKGQKERDRQLKEAREALKVSLRWLNHHEDGYDWCPRCIVEEALARIDEEAELEAQLAAQLLDLASAELARRERAAEEKVACMCGHPRTSHDCHGKCYDIATRGWCSCANFTESPVTDGED